MERPGCAGKHERKQTMKELTQDEKFERPLSPRSSGQVREERGVTTGNQNQAESVLFSPNTWWGRLVFCVVIVGCLLIMLGSALYHIWSQSQAIQMGFVYSRLVEQHKKMKSENNQLRSDVASLLDFHRLAQIGKQELGMQQPQASHVISESRVRHMLLHASQTSGVRLARVRVKTQQTVTMR